MAYAGDPTGTNLTSGEATEVNNSSPIDQKYKLGERIRNLRGDADAVGTISSTTLTLNPDNGASGTVVVPGNLTVNGATTTVSTTNTVIEDRLIEIGTGASTGADSGIVIERGSTGDNAALIWDESRDEFVFATTTATGASTGDLSFTAANLSVAKIGAGTEQAETKVHSKMDTAASPSYSTLAGIIVEDDSRPALQFVGSASNIALIQFGDNASASSGQIYYDHGTDKLRVDAGGNADRITVDANGKLVVATGIEVEGKNASTVAVTASKSAGSAIGSAIDGSSFTARKGQVTVDFSGSGALASGVGFTQTFSSFSEVDADSVIVVCTGNAAISAGIVAVGDNTFTIVFNNNSGGSFNTDFTLNYIIL